MLEIVKTDGDDETRLATIESAAGAEACAECGTPDRLRRVDIVDGAAAVVCPDDIAGFITDEIRLATACGGGWA